MNDWTGYDVIVGVVLCFIVGLNYGVFKERRRLVKSVEYAKIQMIQAVKRFKENLPTLVVDRSGKGVKLKNVTKPRDKPLH